MRRNITRNWIISTADPLEIEKFIFAYFHKQILFLFYIVMATVDII